MTKDREYAEALRNHQDADDLVWLAAIKRAIEVLETHDAEVERLQALYSEVEGLRTEDYVAGQGRIEAWRACADQLAEGLREALSYVLRTCTQRSWRPHPADPAPH